MIKGYIFDLDGTLLDTLASIAASFNRTLATFGYAGHPVDAYRTFIGNGQRKCVERVLPVAARDDATIAAFMAAQSADYETSWQEARPYDGIIEMLARLKSGNARLGVLSNKNHAFAVRCIAHAFPETHFDCVLGYSDQVPHKPDPTGAFLIATAMNLERPQIAFVGDTAMDIETARASAMLPVGVLWGFRDYDELHTAGARLIISQPLDLINATQGEVP